MFGVPNTRMVDFVLLSLMLGALLGIDMALANNSFPIFANVTTLAMAPLLAVGIVAHKRKGDAMVVPWMLAIAGLLQALASLACLVIYFVHRTWHPLAGAALSALFGGVELAVSLRLYGKRRAA